MMQGRLHELYAEQLFHIRCFLLSNPYICAGRKSRSVSRQSYRFESLEGLQEMARLRRCEAVFGQQLGRNK